MSVIERIIAKSTEQFFGFGINSVSTNHISEELGISKRTFYKHFESKRQLVEVIVADEIDHIWKDLRLIQAYHYNTVLEAIKIWDLSLAHKRMRNPNFLRDVRKSYPQVWQLYENFRNEYVQTVLVQNLRRGMAEGYYLPDLKEEITAVLWLDLSQLYNRKGDSDEVIKHHFIRGLLSQRGISEYVFWK